MSGDANELIPYDIQLDLQKQRTDDFKKLLLTLEVIDDKKKILWAQIYEHAIEDRMNAYILFTDLYINSRGKPSEHVENGPVLAKYIERMSRSNDQILKLAELIQHAQEQESSVKDEGDIFDQIKHKKG